MLISQFSCLYYDKYVSFLAETPPRIRFLPTGFFESLGFGPAACMYFRVESHFFILHVLLISSSLARRKKYNMSNHR